MSQNKEKRAELESQAAEIQEQLTETVTEYKKVGNQLLIAGGIVAGGYLLYSMFSGSKKKGSFVSDAIKSYALALALSYAKDLLVDYLASLEAETEAAVTVEDSTVNPWLLTTVHCLLTTGYWLLILHQIRLNKLINLPV